MECIFSNNIQIQCKKDSDPVLSNISFAGLKTVIACSQKRNDTLHTHLNVPGDDVNLRDPSGYKCHKTCKSTYTSELHIKRWMAQSADNSGVEDESSKMPLRSNVRSSTFVWKEDCLFPKKSRTMTRR